MVCVSTLEDSLNVVGFLFVFLHHFNSSSSMLRHAPMFSRWTPLRGRMLTHFKCHLSTSRRLLQEALQAGRFRFGGPSVSLGRSSQIDANVFASFFCLPATYLSTCSSFELCARSI